MHKYIAICLFNYNNNYIYICMCIYMYVCVFPESVVRHGGLRTRARAFAPSSISPAICSTAGN